MDFFTHQQNARNRSGLLYSLFLFSVVAIIAATYFSLCILSPMAQTIDLQDRSASRFADETSPKDGVDVLWWQPQLLFIASGFTIIVVGLGSLYKIAELRGGGTVVALSLGGTPVTEDCQLDSKTKRLINIVEEMALASGIPVPPVFVLEQESSINAFAAGYQPSNAVIGISRGAIDKLTRDELQGVIAHEYSHILNGDMRMNIRLMGLLHGILLIAIIGFYLIRIAGHAGARGRGKNNPLIYFIFLGFAAVLIGSVGLFFARLIKASLSRQREYLADASAVQFTRNPEGIAGALRKIQRSLGGSRIRNPESEVASHLFFGNARNASLISLFSTHPPLEERIRRILPIALQGKKLPDSLEDVHGRLNASGVSQFAAVEAEPESVDGLHVASPAESELKNNFQNSQSKMSFVVNSSAKSDAFDPILRAGAHQGYGSRLIVTALLLSSDSATQKKQEDVIRKYIGDNAAKETIEYYGLTNQLTRSQRLQLIDLCHASLMSLSVSQIKTMKQLADLLIAADGRMDLFEFMVGRILSSRLQGHPDLLVNSRADRYFSYRPYKRDITVVVSAIAYASGLPVDDCMHQVNRAMEKYFPHGQSFNLLSKEDIDLHLVGDAMDRIANASSSTKQKLMSASTFCVRSDQHSTVKEIELLRALGATLAMPCPSIPESEG